jgi:CPA2 family monovalent cation:H+ antiporter-2
MGALQPFAALYVLILAILGPLLTRQSHAVSRALFRLAALVRRRRAGPPAAA